VKSSLHSAFTYYFKKNGHLICPFIGGCVGIVGGIAGILMGIFVGYLVSRLFRQTKEDKAILRYLIHPKAAQWYEAEPGIAAYCALGIIIASQSEQTRGNAVIDQVIQNAVRAFPQGENIVITSCCRIAYSRKLYLKLDMLVHDFMFRRSTLGNTDHFGRHLQALAYGEEAQKTAAYIRSILDPHYQAVQESLVARLEESGHDPWQILGLSPGVSMETVNAQFRKLASQCYPSTQEPHNETDPGKTADFLSIKEAYRQLIRQHIEGK
jgi:hypothetical protein